ncbi:MAG: aldo/keto reductase [Oscillospiraceae bacterium]|nr:aldo/keto reductase [Oscillospiraceae bacterium]
MKYRELAGEQVSVLGFGLMRLPVFDGDPGKIDKEKTAEMIRYAIDNGVNYFDTAYVYHNDKSEGMAGEILSEYNLRDKVKLATKLPTWRVKSESDVLEMIEEQLRRFKTDYIDFYLCHALSRDRFDNVILKYNVLPQLEKAKAEGKIKHIGFSFHDDLDAFKYILDSYDGWEFCQIQLNYINTDYQAGLEGLRYAAEEKGIGVIVMEPLYGGKLADPSAQIVRELPEGRTPVESAFDFLWNIPAVKTALSGMGTMQQMQENIIYASRAEVGMMSDADLECMKKAKHVFDTMALVPCTKCNYCMPCPFGVDIPAIYEAYNKLPVAGKDKAKELYAAINGKGDKCVSCGACQNVCPQSIMTPALMKKIDEQLG